MKLNIALLTVFLALVLTHAHKVEVKDILEMRQDASDDDDDEDKMPLDLEREMKGPQEEKIEGFHILDDNGDMLVEEPTLRVLKALTADNEKGDSITLEEVKAMYEKIQNEKMNKPSQDRLKDVLSKEQNINKEDVKDDSFLNRLVRLVW